MIEGFFYYRFYFDLNHQLVEVRKSTDDWELLGNTPVGSEWSITATSNPRSLWYWKTMINAIVGGGNWFAAQQMKKHMVNEEGYEW